MKKRLIWILLLVWAGGILFPMAWFSKQSGFQALFDQIFTGEWVHIGMHAFLYAIFAMGVFYLLRKKPKAWLWTLLIVLLTGILQESLQVFTSGRSFSFYELFDLGVDLCGAALGLGMFILGRAVGKRLFVKKEKGANV